MNSIILRLPAVRERTGLPTSTIYHYIRLGSFPKQISLGQRSVGWQSQDIDAWIAAKIAAHDESSK